MKKFTGKKIITSLLLGGIIASGVGMFASSVSQAASPTYLNGVEISSSYKKIGSGNCTTSPNEVRVVLTSMASGYPLFFKLQNSNNVDMANDAYIYSAASEQSATLKYLSGATGSWDLKAKTYMSTATLNGYYY